MINIRKWAKALVIPLIKRRKIRKKRSIKSKRRKPSKDQIALSKQEGGKKRIAIKKKRKKKNIKRDRNRKVDKKVENNEKDSKLKSLKKKNVQDSLLLIKLKYKRSKDLGK